MADESKNDKVPGVMAMALANMPPFVKTLMFSILSIPISIAISAMIMQVNVGGIIDKYIDLKIEQRKIELTLMENDIYTNSDVQKLRDWVCEHKADERPEFCP